MSTPTFVVFVGAGGPLSLELRTIEKRQADTIIVAPALRKSEVGLNVGSVASAIDDLKSELDKRESHRESARLLVFLYDGYQPGQFKEFWQHLGRAAWVEFVPENLMHKISQTRQHVEGRINEIRKMLHYVSAAVYKNRRRAPLPLPLQNYQSSLAKSIDKVWYGDLDVSSLKLEIERLENRLNSKWVPDRAGFKDDRDLIFKPCKSGEEHGIAHPQGGSANCFVAGRFRFGAALSPGFHYDVEGPRRNRPLEATLYDCGGGRRDMRSESRTYINIHPNDYLRPTN